MFIKEKRILLSTQKFYFIINYYIKSQPRIIMLCNVTRMSILNKFEYFLKNITEATCNKYQLFFVVSLKVFFKYHCYIVILKNIIDMTVVYICNIEFYFIIYYEISKIGFSSFRWYWQLPR